MKGLDELILPNDVRYMEEHTWARIEGDKVKVGITDYAQDQLGEITFVDLPEADDVFDKGETFGTIESTKSVSELYMPIGGTILTVNDEMEENPELINQSPYEEGWLIELTPSEPAEFENLQTREKYKEMLAGIERIE